MTRSLVAVRLDAQATRRPGMDGLGSRWVARRRRRLPDRCAGDPSRPARDAIGAAHHRRAQRRVPGGVLLVFLLRMVGTRRSAGRVPPRRRRSAAHVPQLRNGARRAHGLTPRPSAQFVSPMPLQTASIADVAVLHRLIDETLRPICEPWLGGHHGPLDDRTDRVKVVVPAARCLVAIETPAHLEHDRSHARISLARSSGGTVDA